MIISDEAKGLRDRMFTKHYPPSSKIWNNWTSIESPGGRCKEDDSIGNTEVKIQELLDAGHKVKTGWCGNTMRNGKTFFILYKKKC